MSLMSNLSSLACLTVACAVFGVELHGEDSSVAFNVSIGVELDGAVHHNNLH